MDELTRFPDLSQLSAAGHELLMARRQAFRLSPKEGVIICGQPVEGTFFVTGGHLRVFMQDSEGREKTLYTVRAGQTCILAVNAAFSGLAYPAWVQSGEAGAEGFVLSGATYRELFESEPVLRDFTIRMLTGWVLELMATIEEGSLRSMEERLARTLLRRTDALGLVQGTHQDLANDLGTAREVVSRHLAQFEQAGLIQRGRGTVTILDRRGLIGLRETSGD